MRRWLSRPGSDGPLHTQGAATSTWRCHGETLLVNNHDAYSVFCRRRDRRLQPLTFQLRHHPNHPGDRTIICRQRRRRRQTLRPPSYGMLQKSSANYTRRRSVKCSSTTITNNITLPPTPHGPQPRSPALLLRCHEKQASFLGRTSLLRVDHNSGIAPTL